MRDQVKGNGSRVLIMSTDDTGTEQYHHVEGLPGEDFAKVMSVRQHGFSSHPPDNSHGIVVALNGRRDLAVVLGGESGENRPTGLPVGGAAMYDTAGTNLTFDAAGNANMVGTGTLTITMDTAIKLIVGGITFEITPSGVAITGGSVTHDGKNIGFDHKHGGVMTGGGQTGVPV